MAAGVGAPLHVPTCGLTWSARWARGPKPDPGAPRSSHGGQCGHQVRGRPPCVRDLLGAARCEASACWAGGSTGPVSGPWAGQACGHGDGGAGGVFQHGQCRAWGGGHSPRGGGGAGRRRVSLLGGAAPSIRTPGRGGGGARLPAGAASAGVGFWAEIPCLCPCAARMQRLSCVTVPTLGHHRADTWGPGAPETVSRISLETEGAVSCRKETGAFDSVTVTPEVTRHWSRGTGSRVVFGPHSRARRLSLVWTETRVWGSERSGGSLHPASPGLLGPWAHRAVGTATCWGEQDSLRGNGCWQQPHPCGFRPPCRRRGGRHSWAAGSGLRGPGTSPGEPAPGPAAASPARPCCLGLPLSPLLPLCPFRPSCPQRLLGAATRTPLEPGPAPGGLRVGAWGSLDPAPPAHVAAAPGRLAARLPPRWGCWAVASKDSPGGGAAGPRPPVSLCALGQGRSPPRADDSASNLNPCSSRHVCPGGAGRADPRGVRRGTCSGAVALAPSRVSAES